jgi:hypothetical protein
MSDAPCAACTPEQQCTPCKEAYQAKHAEQQASQIAATVATLNPEIQMIALGIIMGLQQITETQTDDIATFISKVQTHAKANPEIHTFLQDMTKCYLTAWEFDLLMRCLQGLNATPVSGISDGDGVSPVLH